MCGDDPEALRITGELVRDVGAVPAVLGPLHRARQLEEVAASSSARIQRRRSRFRHSARHALR